METSLAAARCRDGAQLKTFGQLRVGRAGCQTKVKVPLLVQLGCYAGEKII